MKALERLERSGLSRSEIRTALGLKTSHAIRLWERGERFPSRPMYDAIVALAESRGLMLTAADFQSEAPGE